LYGQESGLDVLEIASRMVRRVGWMYLRLLVVWSGEWVECTRDC